MAKLFKDKKIGLYIAIVALVLGVVAGMLYLFMPIVHWEATIIITITEDYSLLRLFQETEDLSFVSLIITMVLVFVNSLSGFYFTTNKKLSNYVLLSALVSIVIAILMFSSGALLVAENADLNSNLIKISAASGAIISGILAIIQAILFIFSAPVIQKKL